MDAKELFGHWADVRAGLLQALGLLSEEQLAFQPREGLWSLGQTICHIAECEDNWFRGYMTGELAGWEAKDFQPADYPSPAALRELLTSVHARIVAMYAQDGDARLEQTVNLPWGQQVTQAWVVWHVLEHEIHHRGEIYLMLGLLGLEAPDV